jgi:hypothetical protein
MSIWEILGLLEPVKEDVATVTGIELEKHFSGQFSKTSQLTQREQRRVYSSIDQRSVAVAQPVVNGQSLRASQPRSDSLLRQVLYRPQHLVMGIPVLSGRVSQADHHCQRNNAKGAFTSRGDESCPHRNAYRVCLPRYYRWFSTRAMRCKRCDWLCKAGVDPQAEVM